MDFTFSFGWMFTGIAITAAGAAIVYFYRWIGDRMASGVSSYQKVKLFGVITIIVGLLVTMNLHTLLLTAFVNILKR